MSGVNLPQFWNTMRHEPRCWFCNGERFTGLPHYCPLFFHEQEQYGPVAAAPSGCDETKERT